MREQKKSCSFWWKLLPTFLKTYILEKKFQKAFESAGIPYMRLKLR